MEKVEKLRSNYKFFLVVIKYLPYLIALLDVIDTFSYFIGIECVICSYIGGISFLTIIFMLCASITFKFCIYHRLPIYYVTINNLMNLYDYYVGISVSDSMLLAIHLVLLFITIIIFTIIHLKNK